MAPPLVAGDLVQQGVPRVAVLTLLLLSFLDVVTQEEDS